MAPFDSRGGKPSDLPRPIGETRSDALTKIAHNIPKLIDHASGQGYLTNPAKMAEDIIALSIRHKIHLKEEFGRSADEIRALARRSVIR